MRKNHWGQTGLPWFSRTHMIPAVGRIVGSNLLLGVAILTRRPGCRRIQKVFIQILIVLVLGQLAQTASAALVKFEPKYTDAAGEGFKDSFSGPEFKKGLKYAMDTWGKSLKAKYVGETIVVDVKFADLPDGVAAKGKPTIAKLTGGAPGGGLTANSAYPIALFNHFKGSDQNAAATEIEITFAKNMNFWTAIGGTNPFNFPRLATVAMHELAHGLGVFSQVQPDGSLKGGPSIFDRFVVQTQIDDDDPALGYPIADMIDTGRASAVTSGMLAFNGAYAMAGLFAPAQFSLGSSIAHLNPTTNPTDLLVPEAMVAFSSELLPSELDVGMLADIGWTTGCKKTGAQGAQAQSTIECGAAVVPLPATMWLFGSGLLGLIGMARRKKA